MKARIYLPTGAEEIIARRVRDEHGWMIGEVERLACSGRTLILLRKLEDAASGNLLVEAERVADQIAALGFCVSLDGGEPRACLDLQVMNATDVCFKIKQTE